MPTTVTTRLWGLAAAALLAAAAAAEPIAERDSFRVGSSGALCTAQSVLTDRALVDMFDRGYAIVCRDAALPVGHVYALRSRGGDPMARLAALRSGRATCQTATAEQIEDLLRGVLLSEYLHPIRIMHVRGHGVAMLNIGPLH